ncbi:MAG TPA: methyl-accepting chemotaxis protein [Acidobacteriaceae bacterium]|nr:methyl-accepting chemotaxis protein [Acidobacteriaceae bacterium]
MGRLAGAHGAKGAADCTDKEKQRRNAARLPGATSPAFACPEGPMPFARLGLKTKVTIGFGSLLTIIAGMGAVAFHSTVLNQRLAHEMRIYSEMKDHSREMQEAFLTERIGTRDVLMGRDNESTHLFEHGEADFRKALDELQPLLATPQDHEVFARTQTAAIAYAVRNEQVIAMYRVGDFDGAMSTFKAHQALVVTTDLTNAMHDMLAEFERRKSSALSQQEAANANTRSLMFTLALVGLALGLGIAQLTGRTIVRTVREMLAMVNMISSNNLTAPDVEVHAQDEMGRAAMGLNQMKHSLRGVILSIASTADEVSGSSREISATAAQSAASAEDQKQQVQRIVATMQQMAATVREVSRHANMATRSAESAAGSAREGGKTVDDVLARMRGIAGAVGESAANMEQLGRRSDEIGRIINVIDEIAEQTNLLALNAAIEAARAGEHGRGFAVVAGEVRRLAERTAVATREIAEVIKSVQSVTAEAVERMRSGTAAVEDGVAVAGKAGDSMQRIVREANNVGEMIAQIADAATQQATATEEITASMTRISGLAADAADGSQLSARACGQLFDMAVRLQKMVDGFDVGQRGPSGLPAHAL